MIAFIRRQIRVGCRNGLIHDSRGDVNALGEYCNMLKDKLNAVISELNQANARIKTWGYKKGSGAQFEPTKNASSIRTIQVDWITLQKFSDLIKDIPENEPIFRYGRQYSMCNSCANDILEAKCKQLGIPVISVHGLRHTHASLLLAAGVSIASVSKRLGHSNMSTTQNIYLHIIRELENKDNALAVSSMLNIGS